MNLAIPLAYFAMGTTLVTALVAGVLRSREFDNGARFFRILFIIAAVTELLLLAFSRAGINNMTVVNGYCLLQFICLTAGLSFWYPDEIWGRGIRIAGALCFVMIFAWIFLRSERPAFDPFSSSAENVLLTIVSGALLVILTRDQSEFLFRNYKFWFTVSVFLYFSVTSVVFATGNYLVDDSTFLRRHTWIINSLFTIVANALYVSGMLCLPRKKI